jgi:selenocysteine lyase/cysteine desulfurase
LSISEADALKIRKRFPVFERKIYVNSCSQGALSDSVEAAFRDLLAGWHREGSPWDLWVQKYEELRASFAAMIGAEPDEVAVVPSASAGINAVASALDFRARPGVVLGEFDFPTMGHVWLAQQSRGAKVRFVPGSGNVVPIEGYERAVNSETLIVPIAHVSFLNGFRSDVRSIVRIAHSHGAFAMLDDYQDCGTRPIDVKALDLDFYVAGTLKYLLSTSGIAFLYVKRDLIQQLTPTISGWFAQRNPFAFDLKHLDPAPTARRFEAGTPPVPNVYATLAALNLLREIGLPAIADRIRTIVRGAIEEAKRLELHVKTPHDSVGPLLVFQAHDADAVVAKLAAANVVASSRRDGVRIAFHVYNTADDVSAVLDVFKKNLGLLVRGCAAK